MASAGYDKPDFWSQKARKEGYPARSVYKLVEIEEKHRLFHRGARVLDLGAAPGSWSLWALKAIGPGGFLCAIDLSPIVIAPAENAFLLQGDLYDERIRAAILERGPYDVVMSDAAPNTTGNPLVDSARSEALVEAAREYARSALKPGGSFIAKIFQGGSEADLLKELRLWFAQARGFKPKACRASSFETYLVATGRK